jgi:ribosome biogenesis GTPase
MRDPQSYERRAGALQRGLNVVPINPKPSDAALSLARWGGRGVGSSGVGKSTLVNTLSGTTETTQQTGTTRKEDAKGRHTTTARSLHASRAAAG